MFLLGGAEPNLHDVVKVADFPALPPLLQLVRQILLPLAVKNCDAATESVQLPDYLFCNLNFRQKRIDDRFASMLWVISNALDAAALVKHAQRIQGKALRPGITLTI